MYNKIALSLCFTLFLGLLSACSPNGILHPTATESSTQKSHKNSENANKDTSISAPVALPPSFGQHPLSPGQTQTAYLPNGLPALKPMKGINTDTLFSENIKDTGDRFNRVENAVTDIRKEFNAYLPSIVRLAAVESDIQNLIKELEVLLQETPNQQQPLDLTGNYEAELQVTQLDPQPPPPPELKDTIHTMATPPPQTTLIPQDKRPPEKPPPKEVRTKEPPPPQYDGIVARNLRAGEHADKVRLVLDTNQSTRFSIDLDNDERLIIIELPEARWVSNNTQNFPDSRILESYSVEPLNDGKGSMVIISLRKDTEIIQGKRLSPDESTHYHRIYFDLKL